MHKEEDVDFHILVETTEDVTLDRTGFPPS